MRFVWRNLSPFHAICSKELLDFLINFFLQSLKQSIVIVNECKIDMRRSALKNWYNANCGSFIWLLPTTSFRFIATCANPSSCYTFDKFIFFIINSSYIFCMNSLHMSEHCFLLMLHHSIFLWI
jgi:hypothetical protein